MLFCQKLESKREEDKKEIEQMKVCMETLQQAAEQREFECGEAVAEKVNKISLE